MKNLKNISAFKFTFILIINLFIHNRLLLLTSILLFVIEYKRKSIFALLLFTLALFSSSVKIDYLNFGIVDDVQNKYIIVDKILYKDKVYTLDNYEIGQIVSIKSCEPSTEISDLKYNIRFYSHKDPLILIKDTPRSFIFRKLNTFNSELSSNLKNIILNIYDSDFSINYLGYGFSFYYLLLFLKRKNECICIITLFIYIICFRFDIKFYLIISELILDHIKITGINKLSFKVLFISLINKYLLFSKGILLSFIFSYIYLNEYDDKSLIMIIQSLFFNQIQIGISFVYKYFVSLRIGLFIFSLLVLICPILSSIYLNTLKICSFLIDKISFSIRGKINIFFIILFFFLIKKLKIKNDYLKVLILIVLMIPALNNPFMHINFIDVGQGDSCLIRDNFGITNVLIDTGSKYNYSKLKNELFKEGIYKIDFLIISHEDEDHSGNVENIKRDFKVKEVITKGKDLNLRNIDLKYLYLGEFDNENDNSLVYLLKTDNREVLFTGDISKKVENIIVSKYDIKNIDVLKIGHHGSNTSSSSYFIGKLNPEFVTISTNGKYNHPHKETLDTLNSYKLDYIITKQEGSIRFILTKLKDLCITNKRIEFF